MFCFQIVFHFILFVHFFLCFKEYLCQKLFYSFFFNDIYYIIIYIFLLNQTFPFCLFQIFCIPFAIICCSWCRLSVLFSGVSCWAYWVLVVGSQSNKAMVEVGTTSNSNWRNNVTLSEKQNRNCLVKHFQLSTSREGQKSCGTEFLISYRKNTPIKEYIFI